MRAGVTVVAFNFIFCTVFIVVGSESCWWDRSGPGTSKEAFFRVLNDISTAQGVDQPLAASRYLESFRQLNALRAHAANFMEKIVRPNNEVMCPLCRGHPLTLVGDACFKCMKCCTPLRVVLVCELQHTCPRYLVMGCECRSTCKSTRFLVG